MFAKFNIKFTSILSKLLRFVINTFYYCLFSLYGIIVAWNGLVDFLSKAKLLPNFINTQEKI